MIHSPVDEVWKALIDPEYIEDWGGGPAKMNDQVGTKFSLWGGDIHGTNIEVEEHERLVQDWFGGDWAEPSKVTIIVTPDNNNQTRIDLIHQNIPDKEYNDILSGWDEYYMGAIKTYLESK